MRRGVVLAAAAGVVVALVVGVLVGVRWWQHRDRTPFAQAAAYAPADAERLTWTDWSGVRDAVGGSTLAELLDAAYERDLSSTSALVESAPTLQSDFGFSPVNAERELFSQSEGGAVVIVRLPQEADVDDVADHLRDLGYAEPDDERGVWRGGDDLLSGIGGGLTPELQYAALVPGERLVLTSDRADYLADVVDDLGEGPSEPVRAVVEASGPALSAVAYDGSYTCSALAMSHADAEEQAEADDLVSKAGEIDPVSAYAMAAQPDGEVRVVLAFESDEQARTNADSRAVLAAGPAPGQGGSFADRFSVASATADGDLVTLRLDPAEGTYVLSDLSSGPVLFATC